MITLGTFMPEYFNQNGDQANLEVLGMQLLWRGLECEVTQADYSSTDFLLVGDASRAVMREVDAELDKLIPLLEKRLLAGLPTLLVGSAHEFFSGRVNGLPALSRGARAGEFREAAHSGLSAFGYRNTEIVEDLFVSGAFISTSLFGPVLAKSPDLLDLILHRLGAVEPLPEDISSELTQLLAEIKKRAIAG